MLIVILVAQNLVEQQSAEKMNALQCEYHKNVSQ